MSQVHFFTNPDNINQTDSQKFGPIDESNYRTNALFTIEEDTEAYAVCDGNLLIFDNEGDESLVNLFIQVTEKTPENFTPNVRYFVYRGLRRDNFMTGTSPSTYKIITKEEAISKGLSFMESLLNTNKGLELSKLYYTGEINNLYNIFNDNFVPVNKGEKIGFYKYISGIYPAFALVLNDESYSFILNLEFAKSEDYKISITFFDVYNSGNELPETLAKREQIHLFLDPAVYWGMQNNSGIILSNTTFNANNHPNDFYDKFIKPFRTKNLFYLDIRNFLDYSLNYYKDQDISGNNISYNINNKDKLSATYQDATYYTNYWPIKIFEISPISGNNFIILNLKFLTKVDDDLNFKLPYIYLDYGVVIETCDHPTEGIQNLTTISRFSIAKNKADKLQSGKQIQLIIPCVSNSNKNNLPWYSKLYYFDGKINSTNKFHKTSMDYVFGGISCDKISNDLKIGSIGNYKYDRSFNSEDDNNNLVLTKRFYNHRKVCIPIGGVNPSTPLILQTGVGLSKKSVVFYAKVISEDPFLFINTPDTIVSRKDSNITIEKNSYISDGDSIIKSDYETKSSSYLKYVDSVNNIAMLYQNQMYVPLEFQLHLSAEEIFEIQDVILEDSNSNALANGNPLLTDLNQSGHELRFVFEPFVGNKISSGLTYGNAIAKLKGIDYDGNQKILPTLLSESNELYINTGGRITYFSQKGIDLDGNANFHNSFEDSNQHPEFPVVSNSTDEYDLIKILKLIHRQYLGRLSASQIENEEFYDVTKFITIWRRYYYGTFDKSGDEITRSKNELKKAGARFLLFDPFEMAIPNAFDSELTSIFPATLLLFYDLTKPEQQKFIDSFLLSQANENSVGDNPSPYIIDPFGKKIDLGHLLYGLDGLINNYDSTHQNYNLFSIYSSNDLTGYIADLGSAAAESRLYKNGLKDKLTNESFNYPENDDIDRLFELNAPDADLLSDVDSFGMFNVYKYFIKHPESDLIPVFHGKKIITIDFLIEYYYNPNFNILDIINFPVASNYKLRWLNFCQGYFTSDAIIPSSTSNNLLYQGFIQHINGEYIWVADTVIDGEEHYSKALLRKRLEAYCHFWYQLKYDNGSVAGVLNKGRYKNNNVRIYKVEDLLRNSDSSKPIRFERPGHLSLRPNLSRYLENTLVVNPNNVSTSSEEIDTVMGIFLTFVKTEFENEKSINLY